MAGYPTIPGAVVLTATCNSYLTKRGAIDCPTGGRSVRSGTSARSRDQTCDTWQELFHIVRVAHAVFPSNFAELVTVTGGEPADVA